MIVPKIKSYLPLALISLYVILSVIKLDHPGFQYDELLFGNAASGGFDRTFIYKQIKGFPLMLMPYIGALKAYFYYPIFLVFNPSYVTVRLPMILLSAASLWLIYKYVSKGAGFPIAVSSLLFLVADAGFISLIRTDVGPVAFGLFFRSLALFYFFNFIEKRRGRDLIVICFAMLAGFYDKLNFLWFIIAFSIAAAVFYGTVFDNIFKLLKTRFAKIAILAFLPFFAVLIFLVFHLGIFSEVSFIPSRNHLYIVGDLSLGLTNGTMFYEYLIGEWNGSAAFGWIIWLIIVGGSILAIRQPKSEAKTFHFFNAAILMSIFLQIALTDKATAPWHVFMLQPMTAILTASSLMFVAKTIFERNETRQKMLLTAVALTIFGVQFFTYTTYISGYEKTYRNYMWSKKIDELQAFSQTVPNRFVSVDWGFHTQLLTLGQQPNKYYEIAFLLNEPLTPEQTQKLESDFLNPDNEYLFLFRNEDATLFKNARRRFFEMIEQTGLQAELIKTFDEDEKPLYEVYRLKQK